MGEKLWVRLYNEDDTLGTECFPATAVGVNARGKITWVQVHTQHRGEIMVARSDIYIAQNPNMTFPMY